MEGISGIETAQQLRQQKHSMPILVLSANAYASDRQATIDAGCNDFLSKPLHIGELLKKIKLHLSLHWTYDANVSNETHTSTNAHMTLPPPNIINHLIQYVRIGDILGLKQELNELIKTDPVYQIFALRIRTLANEFRIDEIKKMLTLHSD